MATRDQKPCVGPSGSFRESYFEELYRSNIDPWKFETSEYEANKYAVTLQNLPRKRYSHALELGCSIGVFTEKLAERCDRLLAVDFAEEALRSARKRCEQFANVSFEHCDLSREFPRGVFDLVVMSEVGYYLSRRDLLRVEKCLRDSLGGEGDLLLIHYTGETNYPLTADEVHKTFFDRPECWRHQGGQVHPGYRIDVFRAGAS